MIDSNLCCPCVFTTREYMESTLTYCSVLTAYPFGFSSTIREKFTTEKRAEHVHTATRWNMGLEMNVEKSGAGESEKDTSMV